MKQKTRNHVSFILTDKKPNSICIMYQNEHFKHLNKYESVSINTHTQGGKCFAQAIWIIKAF